MEFKFTEEQQMMKNALHSLLSKELSIEKLTHILEENEGFSKSIWEKIAHNGWLGVLAKGEEQTLDDLTILDLMYLCESFGEVLFPGPFTMTASYIVPFLSQVELTSGQKELLKLVISGEKVMATAFPRLESEEQGTHLKWPMLEIENEDEEQIRISGELKHIPFLQHAGVKVVSEQSLDLSKPQGTLVLDNAIIDRNEFVERGQDHSQTLATNLVNYLICLNGEMLGGANIVLERTVNYVRERKQFGVPVGSFQAVKHMLADMYAMLEKARSYNLYVAFMYEQNCEENLINVATSRLFTSNSYKEICEQAIQLHGGMGFTWEEGIHFWYKASMYHLYHITHPDVLIKHISEDLLTQENVN